MTPVVGLVAVDAAVAMEVGSRGPTLVAADAAVLDDAECGEACTGRVSTSRPAG